MFTIAQLRKLALSFPEAIEAPHFEKTSFRVHQKIFASYDSANNRACLKLSAIDQNVFATADPAGIMPINNKWGKQGWTFFDLNTVHKDLMEDALTTAYCHVAPRKLAEQIRPS
ncbi:MAG TPA: MmcQ/YjbR family DNA-binding protein [Phnomibacter sp.]|nr:MmcQ/YjbR family DNA-binding protein [Phnomibacter sp.]